MDSTTAMLPSSATRSHSSRMLADKQCKESRMEQKTELKPPLTETEHSLDSEAAQKAHNSSSSSIPHTLHRLSSTDAPDTPTANISWFKHRTGRSRSSSSGDAASLLESDPGLNTTHSTADPQNSRPHTGYDRLHSPAPNHLASTGSSSSSSKKQAATCEPSLTTRLKRRIAWSAKVLQRRASCPGDVLLQRKPTNSSSSTNSSYSCLADQPYDQQQHQQPPLLQSRRLCSSQSCPVLHHTLSTTQAAGAAATTPGQDTSSNSNVAHAQTVLGSSAAHAQQQAQHAPALRLQQQQLPGVGGIMPVTLSPAAAQHAQPLVALSAGARCAVQPPQACPEITPCDSSSTEGSGGTDASSSPEPDDADSAATYPECLFSEGAARITNSFTSKIYTSSKGQKVAIVRVGSIIMAVFVKEPTGEVWECDPDQIAFTGGSSSGNTQGADASSALAAGRICAAGLLSAEAAAKAYNALNRSSSDGGRWQQGCGSCISSSSSVSHCSSSSSRGSWADRAQSLAGTCSHTSSFKSSVSSGSYPSRRGSRRSTCAGKQQPSGVFAFISKCIADWQQRRMEQQQRKAAAYLEELEEGAHLAMRVAGCQSFLLPRNWPDSARKQAQEQRRLRVLLTAYRA